MFTSLKALKWSYNLGVAQERQRIARALERENNQRMVASITSYDILQRDGSKLSSKRKTRLEISNAVANEVNDIINTIMRPKQEYVAGASILFPDMKEVK